jgi:hypothetical protein
MNLKPHSTTPSSYTPVSWDYREVIQEQLKKGTKGKIFYFSEKEGISEVSGKILNLIDEPDGVFIEVDDQSKIRIDRIITLFGKPGAAYDEYDAYANACMECMGGHEMSDFD